MSTMRIAYTGPLRPGVDLATPDGFVRAPFGEPIEVETALAERLLRQPIWHAVPSSGDSVLPTALQELLLAHYADLDAVRTASDEELLAIEGIGDGRLKQIRDILGAGGEPGSA
jgi:ERCC4-type nuclease